MMLRKTLSLCAAVVLAGGSLAICDDETTIDRSFNGGDTSTSEATAVTGAISALHPNAATQVTSATQTTSFLDTTTVTETTTTTQLPDTQAPILLNGGWGTTILKGTDFDLNDYVGYADFYDAVPTPSYTGVVNTEVCGTYPITATIIDDSGNAFSWDLKIKVADALPQDGDVDSSPRLSFDSLMDKHTEEGIRFGIDVSRWQEDIDFEAVKAAGCSFVMMRIGYYYDDINIDEYYLQNIAAAKAAGLDVGVYLYTIANTAEEIKANAKWIADQLDGMQLDFPIAFDWERFAHFQEFAMSIRDLNELYLLFDAEMERYGYPTMLYSSKTYLENFWYVQEEHPVWLAHYAPQTDYEGDYMLWQRSCRGRINGIVGDVDFNILYESEYEKHFLNTDH